MHSVSSHLVFRFSETQMKRCGFSRIFSLSDSMLTLKYAGKFKQDEVKHIELELISLERETAASEDDYQRARAGFPHKTMKCVTIVGRSKRLEFNQQFLLSIHHFIPKDARESSNEQSHKWMASLVCVNPVDTCTLTAIIKP